MNEKEILVAASTTLALLGLCLLWFWLFKDLFVDQFRQKLFALRDELFDFAESGAVPFDNAAYTTLRMTMNGFIRYGHRFNLLSVLLFLVFTRRKDIKETNIMISQEWETLLIDFPKETKDTLLKTYDKMNNLVLGYLLVSSPFLFLLLLLGLLPLVLLLFALCGVSSLKESCKRALRRINSAAGISGNDEQYELS